MTTVINIKTDSRLKAQAQKTASEMGLTLSAVVNGLLKKFVSEKKVTFEVPEIPSKYLLDSIRKSEEEIKNGRVSPTFDNVEDAIEWLNKET